MKLKLIAPCWREPVARTLQNRACSATLSTFFVV